MNIIEFLKTPFRFLFLLLKLLYIFTSILNATADQVLKAVMEHSKLEKNSPEKAQAFLRANASIKLLKEYSSSMLPLIFSIVAIIISLLALYF